MEMKPETNETTQIVEDGLTPANQPVEVVEPTQEVVPVQEVVVDAEGENETAAERTLEVYPDRESVLAAARELASHDAADITREEVAHLKQQYYSLAKNVVVEAAEGAEADQAVAAVEEETEAAEVSVAADAADEEFKAILAVIKEKKAQQLAAQEAARQANLEKCNAIIEKILEMSADADNVNREFPNFRELQQQFKEAGEVPPQAQTDLWKRYQDAVERFYDQYRVNKDLRDYDFKKNLETKTLLCDEAERLKDEEDVVAAFRRLQSLHDKWRETGPVAKDLRDSIWLRFKDASAEVNKRYQAFFEERKAREQANEDAKTALCEQAEAVDYQSATSFAAWDKLTAQVLTMQQEWKKLGYASRKSNNKLFARFRAACDRFFTAKAEFYKESKDRMSENMRLKTLLCEEAETLSQSTEWKKTAERLVELQKQWKSIGAVPRKYSDALWERFQKACDYFFDLKKKDLNELRRGENQALKAKKEITARINEAIADESMTAEKAEELLRQAAADWKGAGHVPFREKDRVYDDYRKAMDTLREKHGLTRSSRQMARFESALSEMGDNPQLGRERERLVRAYDARCQELKTCENNMGFFTTKTSKGNAMLQELQRRIATLREDIETLRKKIALIDEKL